MSSPRSSASSLLSLALPLVALTMTGGSLVASGAPVPGPSVVREGPGAEKLTVPGPSVPKTGALGPAVASRRASATRPGTHSGKVAALDNAHPAAVIAPVTLTPARLVATAFVAGRGRMSVVPPAPGPARPNPAHLRAAGLIATFGDARFLGAPGKGGPQLVSVAASPRGRGYWAADVNGAVFAYGGAHFYGSLLGVHPAAGIAAMAATPDGRGYWLVSKGGGVFTFGDARYYQSLGHVRLRSAVVGISPTPDGRGYWLATAAGGVYSFGNAKFLGSLGRIHLGTPVIGIASTRRGNGYWLATAGGGVFSFAGAKFFGSLSSSGAHLSAIAAARSGQGYWLLSANGRVHGFGAAPNFGSVTTGSRVEASALAPTGTGGGYVVATKVASPGAGTAAGAKLAVMSAPGGGRTYLGTFMVTCYDLTGVTASGSLAGPESAAVDPGVIPLGTRIYVDGVGRRTADDTGGAIIGDHIDIWEPTYTECADWGVQDRSVYRFG